MSKKTFPMSSLAVSGIAGHGKDTFISTVIENHKDSSFIPIRMATELKKFAANILPQSKVDEMGMTCKQEAMEHLKNNDQEYKVIGDFNARQVQQKMGTEILRSFDESIHIVIECSKIAASDAENAVFYSADIRFKNELEFMLNLKDDPKDFSRFIVNQKQYDFSSDDIIKKMSDVFGEDILKIDDFDKMKGQIDEVLNRIKNTEKPMKEHNIKSLDRFDMKNQTLESSFDLGYINVFRPVLSDDFISKNAGKNLPAAKIRQEIRDYTKLSSDQVYDIQQYYKISKIDFTVENIKEYGFLRADISHISERDLDMHKPQPFVSIPHHLCDPVEKIIKLTSNRNIEKTLTKKNELLGNPNIDSKKFKNQNV